jgi:hypothetical protein
MTNYEKALKDINRNKNIALAFAFIPAFLFPVAFELIINGGEVIALLTGLFYAVTGFLSIYYSNK